MSQYTNQADIEGEIQDADLIQLTDDGGTGFVNQTVLTQVIENASGEIDRFVGNIYDIPFNPTPPSVESMAIIITCYRLYRRREVPDEKNKYYEDYKEVRKFLNGVNNGTERLDLSVKRDFSQVAASFRATPWGFGNQIANSM